MKRWQILTGITVGLVAAGGLFYWSRLSRSETVHPHRGDIVEAVYGLGKVKSHHKYEVIAGVSLTISRLYVREGDRVEKGAPLVAFDTAALIRAPFAGTVTYVKGEEREIVAAQVPVIRLEDLSDLFIELSLEQEGALQVKRGLPAKVSFESVRGKILTGEVTALFPRQDEFLANVKVDGLESSVLPGMTADVTIEIGKIKDVVLIPLRAVQNGMVAVKRNGKWKKEKVEVGRVDGVYAEVKDQSLTTEDEIRLPKAQED